MVKHFVKQKVRKNNVCPREFDTPSWYNTSISKNTPVNNVFAHRYIVPRGSIEIFGAYITSYS